MKALISNDDGITASGILASKKAVEDLLKKYELEKLENKRNSLLLALNQETDIDKKKSIGKELNDIVLILSKINQGGYKNIVQP